MWVLPKKSGRLYRTTSVAKEHDKQHATQDLDTCTSMYCARSISPLWCIRCTDNLSLHSFAAICRFSNKWPEKGDRCWPLAHALQITHELYCLDCRRGELLLHKFLCPQVFLSQHLSPIWTVFTPTHTRFLRQENKGTSSAIQCAWHLPSARSCITTSTSVSHCHMHNFITQSCVFVPSSSQQFHPWSISIIHSLPSILWSLCAFGRLCWVWFEPALEVELRYTVRF